MARRLMARLAPAMPPAPLQLFPGHSPAELGLIREYFRLDPAPEKGFVVDRLGVRTAVTGLWDGVAALDGTVAPPPLEADFHAEAVEWIGLLKSVEAARECFVAMELGAGWGPWLVAGTAAARRRGIGEIRLTGVEADPAHFAAMRAHFVNNGLDPDAHRLHCAAVGAAAGTAYWPRVADPRNDWGSRPAADAGATAGGTMPVQVLAIGDLLATEPVWDLVHIDVQGAEAEICPAAAEAMNARVRFLVIGTHSRAIEGDLIRLFREHRWVLENEKPCRFAFSAKAPTLEAMTTLDGTQVWRNPRLGA
jgi:FkbM family methyltransferase